MVCWVTGFVICRRYDSGSLTDRQAGPVSVDFAASSIDQDPAILIAPAPRLASPLVANCMAEPRSPQRTGTIVVKNITTSPRSSRMTYILTPRGENPGGGRRP